MQNVYIGSARHDELGGVNGKAGDQLQTSAQDYNGEVSQQTFYWHSKGWILLRLKDPTHRIAIAESMMVACNNNSIGYSQKDRLSIINDKTYSNTPTNCDCSSLVRECFIEATGIDPGNFTTYNERIKLISTGLVDIVGDFSVDDLITGDILVTKTKGHTAIVTHGKDESCPNEIKDDYITDLARRVYRGEFGNGAIRRMRIEHIQLGLYAKVQERVKELYY